MILFENRKRKQRFLWIGCVGLMMGILVSCGTENEPTYTLTTTVTPDGIGTIEPASGEYTEGEVVTITASTSSAGWQFKCWAGDLTVASNPTTITMTSDYSLIGVFEQDSEDSNLCRYSGTEVVDVVNPSTGVTWMDRNLGASRAATSSTDAEAYGDLYQWGRGADGHQKRTSGTRSTLSTTDQPGHGDFITISIEQSDWRSPGNDKLWQGEDGVNNPCPVGYRLPTAAEWESELQSWGSSNSAGAYDSPLKLPVAGIRFGDGGSLIYVDEAGFYWSSSVVSTSASYLVLNIGDAFIISQSRANGQSVRCRKD